MSESFSKSDRLLTRAEFIRVQNRGRKVHTKSLLLLVLPNSRGKTRLGVAVSKKLGKSVLRNRFKRLVREVFRRNRELFPEEMDVVVVPKRVTHPVNYRRLVQELSELSRRAWGCAGC